MGLGELDSTLQELHPILSIPLALATLASLYCSNDTDFSEKADKMCQFFKTHGYPNSLIHNRKHCVQSVHPQSAPQSSHNKQDERIPLTLTFYPHNLSVNNILKNFKLLQYDPINADIFSLPLLMSYKRNNNISNQSTVHLNPIINMAHSNLCASNIGPILTSPMLTKFWDIIKLLL